VLPPSKAHGEKTPMINSTGTPNFGHLARFPDEFFSTWRVSLVSRMNFFQFLEAHFSERNFWAFDRTTMVAD
jgi:hypothetical protein